MSEQVYLQDKLINIGPLEKSSTKNLMKLSEIKEEYERRGKDKQWLVKQYKAWASRKDYLLLVNKDTNELVPIPIAKRGNERYQWRMRTKLRILSEDLSGKEKYCKKRKTKAFFITLTYDPKIKGQSTLDEQWCKVGKDWNNFMSRLRRTVGSVEAIRVFETTKKGAPHIHAVIFTKDKAWTTSKVRCQDGKYRWLLRAKPVLEKIWINGFIQVSGIVILARAMNYILGTYFGKGYLYDEQNSMGLAMMWIYRKRAMSYTRNITLLDSISIIKKMRTRVDTKFEFLAVVSSRLSLHKMDIVSYEVQETDQGLEIFVWCKTKDVNETLIKE